MPNKRGRKSIHDIYKGTKRLEMAKRESQNNSLSHLRLNQLMKSTMNIEKSHMYKLTHSKNLFIKDCLTA